MSENPLANVGDLAKPATVLIEKISDAIGGIFRPFQIKRVAQAEAEAEIIKASAQFEITEIQQRALKRFIQEETIKQSNIESITAKAISNLEDTAEPQNIENDWIANFFDKCRLISDDQMQTLWSKVLSGEANNPGKYSKRTVNFLSSIDKSDAILFTNLCAFCCHETKLFPMIYSTADEIYLKNGINFDRLKHLDGIGLISFESVSGYKLTNLNQEIQVRYFDSTYNLRFEEKEDNSYELNIGKALMTKVGQELASISGAQAIPNFETYLIEKWANFGITVYSKLPNIS